MADQVADRAEITQILRIMADAWNAGDGAGYAAPSLEDADYISFDGNHATGRQAIAESDNPNTDPDRDSIATLILVRTDDGWKVASFQNSRRQRHGHGH